MILLHCRIKDIFLWGIRESGLIWACQSRKVRIWKKKHSNFWKIGILRPCQFGVYRGRECSQFPSGVVGSHSACHQRWGAVRHSCVSSQDKTFLLKDFSGIRWRIKPITLLAAFTFRGSNETLKHIWNSEEMWKQKGEENMRGPG